MSYTVLARRYRSATFDEVVGQNHVAQTLKKAIQSGRIAHAYLFCGTRGVGKTSMARILAKALNCEKSTGPTTEPCLQCPSCQAIARGEDMDVIEIDAASNTGVDNIRELIENSQYRPARCRFKVYIIDEVHMLSKSAFNALLKTLEEPPSHVKFILATTEAEKVLPTILSRCQRYDFRNIPTREIAGHLKNVCSEEKIEADDDAVMLVAKAGAGSMRDSLSLLDRLLSIGEKRLSVDTIEQLLGLPKSQRVLELAQAIGEGRVKDALTLADRMIAEGLSPDGLIVALIDHFRNLLILRTCGTDSNLVEVAGVALEELGKQSQQFDPIVLTQDITILEDLRRQLRTSSAGRALLDATLVRLALAEQFASIGDLLAQVNGQAPATSPAQKKKFDQPLTSPPRPIPPSAPTPIAPRRDIPERDIPEVSAVAKPPAPSIPPTPIAPPEPPPALDDLSLPVAPPPPAAFDSPAPAPVNSAPVEEEDDDLPAPGKVWDASPSVSLGTLMARHAAKTQPPTPAPPPAGSASFQPVDPGNLPVVWRNLLKLLQDKSIALHSLVAPGKLIGIIDDQAIIQYGSANDTFPKLLNRNGKKEAVSEAFSQVLGRSIGVRFEVTDTPESSAVPADAGAVSSEPSQQADPSESTTAAHSAQPPARLTMEMRQELEKDPLLRALISAMDATIVKLADD